MTFFFLEMTELSFSAKLLVRSVVFPKKVKLEQLLAHFVGFLSFLSNSVGCEEFFLAERSFIQTERLTQCPVPACDGLMIFDSASPRLEVALSLEQTTDLPNLILVS